VYICGTRAHPSWKGPQMMVLAAANGESPEQDHSPFAAEHRGYSFSTITRRSRCIPWWKIPEVCCKKSLVTCLRH
jgi:hypothetical protein